MVEVGIERGIGGITEVSLATNQLALATRGWPLIARCQCDNYFVRVPCPSLEFHLPVCMQQGVGIMNIEFCPHRISNIEH